MANDKIQLEVAKREISGKKVATLRRDDIVPMTIYGADFAPVNIQAPLNVVKKVANEAGTHTPVEVLIDGKAQTAIIKSIDIDPTRNMIQHVAFQAISADEVVTTEVPILIIDEDESDAKKAGLVILQSLEKIEVKAKAADLPENLEVSAAALKEQGEHLTLADIKLPNGVEFADKELALEQVVATTYEPSALAAANEAADAEAEATSEGENAENEGEETGNEEASQE